MYREVENIGKLYVTLYFIKQFLFIRHVSEVERTHTFQLFQVLRGLKAACFVSTSSTSRSPEAN